MEKDMERGQPTVIDLNAEAAKLTMLRGRTAQTTFAERRASGSAVHLGRYRNGMLLLAKSAGKSHWETHPDDELLYVLDGEMTVDILEKDGPKSFVVGAGMIAIVPPGAWHRVHSADGMTVASATLPGDHIELDVDDPRTSAPDLAISDTLRPASIIDLNAELAKLTMFRGRTPQSTMADRKGSSAQLAPYRDGGLFITKFAGKGHWEAHLPGDELVHVLDGTAILEIVCDDEPPKSFALSAGMTAVNPQGAWHRFHSSDGVTLMTATPSPSKVIELDIDDPRTADLAHTQS
jgi:mannose-6-phosphate isomerase-like protein (cupin superfamily)